MARDTDLDWNLIAEREPYFGVLANERFLRGNLDERAIDDFYASGRADIDHVVAMRSRIDPSEFSPVVALDFGCGVGRLTLAMAAYAKRVIGVDVADAMLSVARDQAPHRGGSDVDFVTAIPSEPVDWINSLIVFQHIAPARGYGILSQLVEILAPGGFISIQLTFFRDASHVGELVRDISDYRYDGEGVQLLGGADQGPPGAMSMYDYDLNVVLRTFFLAGISPLVMEHTDHGGCHGSWLIGVKR